jgi:hypothetical protein
MTMRVLLPILLFASLGLSPAWAQDEVDPEGSESANLEAAETTAPSDDPLTTRLKQMIDRYYTGIGAVPTDAEMTAALASIQFMLLDGVNIRRIAAGVNQAIRLSTPGRRTPFEVAVPLRIAPAQPADQPETETSSPPLYTGGSEIETPSTTAGSGTTTPPRTSARAVDPETERRWEEAQTKLKEKRARRRLYRQWRDRTREKRALLSLGIPLLATGYAIGFAGAGAAVTTNQADHAAAWAAAIPVVGPAIFMGMSGISEPWPLGLTVLQGVGVGFTVAGLAIKIDWPYDRDPMALTVTDRSGRAALRMQFKPMAAGGALVGTF